MKSAPRALKPLLAILLLAPAAAHGAILIGGGTGSGISVTASDYNAAGAGFPEIRTIDGSGLNAGTGVHNTDAGTSWLVNNGNPVNEWIEWDLGASYALDTIHVWNANQQVVFGMNSVDIYVSNAAVPGDPEGAEAANWTQLGGSTLTLPIADNSGGYTGFDLETATSTTLPTTGIRFVRFEVNSGHGSSYVGIAEIQFTGTAIPEPSTALLGAFGLLCLLRRRR